MADHYFPIIFAPLGIAVTYAPIIERPSGCGC